VNGAGEPHPNPSSVPQPHAHCSSDAWSADLGGISQPASSRAAAPSASTFNRPPPIAGDTYLPLPLHAERQRRGGCDSECGERLLGHAHLVHSVVSVWGLWGVLVRVRRRRGWGGVTCKRRHGHRSCVGRVGVRPPPWRPLAAVEGLVLYVCVSALSWSGLWCSVFAAASEPRFRCAPPPPPAFHLLRQVRRQLLPQLLHR
jgi:hypothetical protein